MDVLAQKPKPAGSRLRESCYREQDDLFSQISNESASTMMPGSKTLAKRRSLVSLIVWAALCLCFAENAFAQVETIPNGRPVKVPLLLPGQWKYFRIEVEDWHSELEVTVDSIVGNPDLYVGVNRLPTELSYDYRSIRPSSDRVSVDNFTAKPLKSGTLYIGVVAASIVKSQNGTPGDRSKASFEITATKSSRAASIAGMGAIPFEGGTAFRIWAPFADSVHVAGQFNQWHDQDAGLISEGNGFWSVEQRNASAGQRYKYVIRNGDSTLWRNDPYEPEAINSISDSVIYDDQKYQWESNDFEMPAWNRLVIYEMHIGTLNDQPGGGPGTFASAIERLDHIANLGCNAVCVMPVAEFPGDFSWGYNPSLPFAVESAYGGPDHFKKFVDEAHQRGIAVLLDVVHNHWGPTDLALWQFDGWHENDWGGIYFYNDTRAITPWGDTRPDYGRPEVQQFILDNVMMWLEEFRCDGLRVDSTLNIHTHGWGDNPEGWSLLQWINDEIDRRQPWKISIAEDLQGNGWITRETSTGGAGFDSQWSSEFVHPVRAALEASNDSDRDMHAIASAVGQRYSEDAFERVIYTESHDEVANGRARVPEEIWPGNATSWASQKRSTLGAVLVMTSPGVPMIFQGQEILEDGYFRDDDPVDWSKKVTHAGIEQLYRDLASMRRGLNPNTKGLQGHSCNVFHVNNQEKVVAFHRWDQGGNGDDVLVVCNFSVNTLWNYRIGLPRDGLWKVRFNSDWTGYSDAFGNHFTADVTSQEIQWDELPFSGTLSLPPYSAVILSQDPLLRQKGGARLAPGKNTFPKK